MFAVADSILLLIMVLSVLKGMMAQKAVLNEKTVKYQTSQTIDILMSNFDSFSIMNKIKAILNNSLQQV